LIQIIIVKAINIIFHHVSISGNNYHFLVRFVVFSFPKSLETSWIDLLGLKLHVQEDLAEVEMDLIYILLKGSKLIVLVLGA
jgi:hypothetical protein